METNRGLTLIGGIGLGAAAMYFLDPDRGNRRRALARDQLVHSLRQTEQAAGKTARDLGNRTRGLVAETKARLRSEDVSDDVLVARVKANLGRVTSHPRAIEVAAEGGRVTLSGPVLAREVDRLLDSVRSVRGVTEVENRLDVYERPDDLPSLQGGETREGARAEFLQEKWAPAARLAAGVVGGALAVSGTRRRDPLGAVLGLVGLGLLARALTNIETKRLLSVRAGRRAVDIQKTINIAAPVERVFDFWRQYANFPRFMSHVREVRDLGNGRSHWVVDGPAGVPIEWDAELTSLVPNEVLAWKTVAGSVVDHAGIIRFEPTADGTTRVAIKLSYNPPAGAVGHGAAVLFRADPKQQLDDDLARVKTMLETGSPPRDAAEPARTEGRVTSADGEGEVRA